MIILKGFPPSPLFLQRKEVPAVTCRYAMVASRQFLLRKERERK